MSTTTINLTGVQPLMVQNWSIIDIPSGFNHPLAPFFIRRKVNSCAELLNYNSSTLRKKIDNPVIKYVDQINGLDTNTGDSWAQAYKSFTKLRTVAFDRAYLAKGNYASLVNPPFTTENEIISVGGSSNVCFGFIGTERIWTSIGGGAFSNSITSNITVVLDTSKTDINGNPFRLQKMTNLTDVQNTPDSFWKDSGTNIFYVHYADGMTPSRTSSLMAVSAVSNTNGFKNYRENINFINGISTNNNTASTINLLMKNCKFIFNTTQNGVTIFGNVISIFENCEASNNALDGFNYHDTASYDPYSIEINCSGFQNGEGSTTSINNGSTMHDDGMILRIGGIYCENEGPNVHDVNNAKSLNVDCVAYTSTAVNSANKSDFAIGALASENCIMWLDGCVTHNENDTFGAEDRAGLGNIFTRNTNIFNIETGTTLTPY